MIRYTFLILLCVIFVSGCVRKPIQYGQLPSTDNILQNICLEHNIPWQWDGIDEVVSLDLGKQQAQLLIGSPLVMIGDEQIMLSEPIRRKSGMIVVPPDFKRRVLGVTDDKHIDRNVFRLPALRKVIIDAGHGGKDPGAIGFSGSYEKDVVLDIAKRTKKILSRRGIKVIMTRKSDEFISLAKRTEVASKHKADLFVSIHANSIGTRKVHGVEVFYYRGLIPKDLKEQQRLLNHQSQFKRLHMKRSKVLNNIVADMLYVHKQSTSPLLAKAIVDDIAHDMRSRNRGAKTSRFYVLRNTLIPAVLVEVGFLSNKSEERRLKEPAYRQRVAESIVKSIMQYAHES